MRAGGWFAGRARVRVWSGDYGRGGGVGSRRIRRRYLEVGLRVRVFNISLYSEGSLGRELNGLEEAQVWAGRKTFGKFFCGTDGLM